jgi:hypothetical protein
MKAQILVAVILVGANSAFPQSGFRSENPARHTTAPHRFFPGAFPWFLGDYGYGYDGYSSAPSMVMLPQPPLYVLMPPVPAEPPRPEIHEYQSSAPTANEDQTFAIVLRDGSMHSAVAVTVQKGALYYVEPDGAHRLVALNALDREATERLNRERKLQLQLPPAP